MSKIILVTFFTLLTVFLFGCPPAQPENGSTGNSGASDIDQQEPAAPDASGPQGTMDEPAEVSEGGQIEFPGENHLANLRQLTFEGENAEAYFSSDGKNLIFQRHVESGECDQIFVMDIESGEFNMVSTGDGVTTCAYYKYPDNDKIIYASTHLFHTDCPSPVDKSLGYVWKFHPEWDVFEADPDGSNLVQLTDAPGYDAEGTYAPDGSLIVYTSMSSGDLEIWTMNPDGSDKKQLTDTLGYDGGAFFTYDSSKIVFRAYHPETEDEIQQYNELLAQNLYHPSRMDLWIMDRDGANLTRITHDNETNWAPYPFPDGNRLLFSSNRESESPMDFNLWIIDIETGDLEQVTFFPGFDGFAVFSPDGSKIVFCSNRNESHEGNTNVFIADWVE
jgi:Tol biopolymer transport system component